MGPHPEGFDSLWDYQLYLHKGFYGDEESYIRAKKMSMKFVAACKTAMDADSPEKAEKILKDYNNQDDSVPIAILTQNGIKVPQTLWGQFSVVRGEKTDNTATSTEPERNFSVISDEKPLTPPFKRPLEAGPFSSQAPEPD